jgi:ketosteroid isomerase-like protein
MKMKAGVPTLVSLVVILSGGRGAAAQSTHARRPAVDSAAIMGVVNGFHAALERGDSAAVSALLDQRLEVLESGDYETRDDYLRHHLGADLAFARTVRSSRQVRRIAQAGDGAWVVSTSRAAGTFAGRPVDSEGAELMVLTRTSAGWRIAAIHWSSHRRQR